MRILDEQNQVDDVLTDDGSSVSSDDSDGWMTVYNDDAETFGDVCDDPALQQYAHFKFFQCWGGGPFGGFIQDPDEIGPNFYRVNKSGFGEPWVLTPMQGFISIMDPDDSVGELGRCHAFHIAVDEH